MLRTDGQRNGRFYGIERQTIDAQQVVAQQLVGGGFDHWLGQVQTDSAGVRLFYKYGVDFEVEMKIVLVGKGCFVHRFREVQCQRVGVCGDGC